MAGSVFLVDTSASMNQRTYLGTSLLDVAKWAVENFMKVIKIICGSLYVEESFVIILVTFFIGFIQRNHYSDVIMGAVVSQITSLTAVYSTVYSGADQRKHQSSASLAFVWGIHRWPVNSPHKWPVTRKRFPLMTSSCCSTEFSLSVLELLLFQCYIYC